MGKCFDAAVCVADELRAALEAERQRASDLANRCQVLEVENEKLRSSKENMAKNEGHLFGEIWQFEVLRDAAEALLADVHRHHDEITNPYTLELEMACATLRKGEDDD